MTPLSIWLLRLRLWWECLHEQLDFTLTVKRLKPKGQPPFDWQPYWVIVNRIGRWPKRQSRTLGALQQFEDVMHMLQVARQQAFEILHPKEAEEIAARERPNIPPPPPPQEHEYQHRLVEKGVVASCKCGWDSKAVCDVAGIDPTLQVEFDRHLNEVEALARAGKGMPPEFRVPGPGPFNPNLVDRPKGVA